MEYQCEAEQLHKCVLNEMASFIKHRIWIPHRIRFINIINWCWPKIRLTFEYNFGILLNCWYLLTLRFGDYCNSNMENIINITIRMSAEHTCSDMCVPWCAFCRVNVQIVIDLLLTIWTEQNVPIWSNTTIWMANLSRDENQLSVK